MLTFTLVFSINSDEAPDALYLDINLQEREKEIVITGW